MGDTHGTVGIVLPPVWTHVYLQPARLVQAALADLGYPGDIVEWEGRARHDWHVVLGWNLYETPFPRDLRYVLYQMEPLSLPFWREKAQEKRSLFESAQVVWDYSRANLPFLDALPARWVPLGYHPALDPQRPPEPFPVYDVLFARYVSARRRDILEELADRCLVAVQQRWGDDLGRALANSKLVLNLHQYDDPTPLEQPRLHAALQQGSFVLTEESSDDPYPWVASAPYDRLIEQCLHYLHHPTDRRERQAAMQAGFRSLRMVDCLRSAIVELEEFPCLAGRHEG